MESGWIKVKGQRSVWWVGGWGSSLSSGGLPTAGVCMLMCVVTAPPHLTLTVPGLTAHGKEYTIAFIKVWVSAHPRCTATDVAFTTEYG